MNIAESRDTEYKFIVLKLTLADDTLITPFTSTDGDVDDWYVISYLGHADKELVAKVD